jgi:lipopolysaccharide/colanic/teichoic acid biosynthesis glycosyltransferase
MRIGRFLRTLCAACASQLGRTPACDLSSPPVNGAAVMGWAGEFGENRSAPTRTALLLKAALDYSIGGCLFLLATPLFLVIACAIKLVSSGPIFFKQVRSGLNGRPFTMYKFRTMVNGADFMRNQLSDYSETDGPVFKIRNDPRIIPFVGGFLRKTSLDELTQLVNVIRGEMSLVGPRPPLPEEVAHYEAWQKRRLAMKPGLTCIWQIQPRRNEIPFHTWMEMDLHYIDRWSLSLDLKILLRTLPAVLCEWGE